MAKHKKTNRRQNVVVVVNQAAPVAAEAPKPVVVEEKVAPKPEPVV